MGPTPTMFIDPIIARYKARVGTHGTCDPVAEGFEAAAMAQLSGKVKVGSSLVEGLPPWALKDTARGGFLTGEALSKLNEGESNHYWTTSAGMKQLLELFHSRKYNLRYPEYGYLMMVAVLTSKGRNSEANALRSTLEPYMEVIRFFPDTIESPLKVDGLTVFRTSAGEAVDTLKSKARARLADPKLFNNIAVWTRWLDLRKRLCDFWGTTVDSRSGYPGQVFPPGWRNTATAINKDYHTALKKCSGNGRYDWLAKGNTSKRNSTAWMHEALVVALGGKDTGAVSSCGKAIIQVRSTSSEFGLHLGRVKMGLDAWNHPEHGKCSRLFKHRETLPESFFAPPGKEELALAARLEEFDQCNGLTPQDFKDLGPVASHLQSGIECCRRGTLVELVNCGGISSIEVLAGLADQITAALIASSLNEPERYFETLTRLAFGRRQGILLTDLSAQIRFEKILTAPIIAKWHLGGPTDEGCNQIFGTLQRICRTMVTMFPATPVPNAALSTLRDLCGQSGLLKKDDFDPPHCMMWSPERREKLPQVAWIDELAPDIFQGKLTAKFMCGALWALRQDELELYYEYYGITPTTVLACLTGPNADLVQVCTDTHPILKEEVAEKLLARDAWLRAHPKIDSRTIDPKKVPHGSIPYSRVVFPQKEYTHYYSGGVPTTYKSKDREEYQRISPCLTYGAGGEPQAPQGTTGYNGMVLEQLGIITTHNLATTMHLADLGGEDIKDSIRTCWKQIRTLVENGSILEPDSHLKVCKNVAYAWRQLIVFASLVADAVGRPAVAALIASLAADLSDEKAEHRMLQLHFLTPLHNLLVGAPRAAPPIYGWTLNTVHNIMLYSSLKKE